MPHDRATPTSFGGLSGLICDALDLDPSQDRCNVQSLSSAVDADGQLESHLYPAPQDPWCSFMLAPSESMREQRAGDKSASQYESELVGHAEASEEYGVVPGRPLVRVAAVAGEFESHADGADGESRPVKEFAADRVRALLLDLQAGLSAPHSTTKLNPLILFEDAVSQVFKLSRILGLSSGHAIVSGAGGSGRRSLSALAAYAAGCIVVQPALELEGDAQESPAQAGVTASAWDPAIVRAIRIAGLTNRGVSLIIADSELPQGSSGHAILQQIARLLTADPLSMLPRDVRASIIAEASAELPRLRAAVSSAGGAGAMHLGGGEGVDQLRFDDSRSNSSGGTDGLEHDGMTGSVFSDDSSDGGVRPAAQSTEQSAGAAEELLLCRIRANLHLVLCVSERAAAGSMSVAEIARQFPSLLAKSQVVAVPDWSVASRRVIASQAVIDGCFGCMELGLAF